MSTFSDSGRAASAIGPATRLAAVSPNDAAALPAGPCRSLFVSVGGSLTIVDLWGTVVTMSSGNNQYHPIQVSQVRATGTSASGILALY
jgi:hypothetical protein